MESNKKSPAWVALAAELAAALLRYFDRVARDLPWRRRRDAYGIWVSEIMLQQTQVVTVSPRYERFLERFPDVESLAAAELDAVLAEWAGLGYYRRARQMHQAAQIIVERGGFPRQARDLATLPGIGPYTAAAIASMAFGEVVPVLDGNVERVLCRFLALEADPKERATRQRLLETARSLLDTTRPGDGNQALMELGATICTPTRPACERCPLQGACVGQMNWQRYPRYRPRRAVERQNWAMALVADQGKWLLVRRAENAELLAGLWELPLVWVADFPEGGAERAAEQLLAQTYGGQWRLGPALAQVRHAITYRDLRVTVFRASLDGKLDPEQIWCLPESISELASSSLVGKVIKALAKKGVV